MAARRQLARRRKALGCSQESLAEALRADRATVGRWERGETEPHPYLRPRLADALGLSAIELDTLLSAEDASTTGSAAESTAPEAPETHPEKGDIDEMIRREFLGLMSLTGALISLPTSDVSDRADEAQPETQTLATHLWQVYGLAKAKRSVYPLVRDQLSDLAYTLGRPHPEFRHREICAEAAGLYQLAGEIHFDGNQYTRAAECYALAAGASKEAGNADLWAASLTRHAFIGLYERRFQQTVPLLDAADLLARKGDSRLSTRYWVAAVQAQVYAGLGDLDACNRSLDAAQEVHHLKCTTSMTLALVAGYGSTAPASMRNAAVAT